jgi:hypothetical protein
MLVCALQRFAGLMMEIETTQLNKHALHLSKKTNVGGIKEIIERSVNVHRLWPRRFRI